MTTKSTPNAAPANQTNPQGEQNVPFGIITQYIKDQSFENPNPVEAFLTQHETQPNISVDIAARANKVRDGVFEVILDLKTKGQFSENKPLFIAELCYAALIAIDESQVPTESVAPLLMIHFPTLLFPFARAIMSDMTRDGGFPALMLNPVDFGALYQEKQNEGTAAA